MEDDSGTPPPTAEQPAQQPAERPVVEFCRFGWAVPGGTGHVCYRDPGHEPPHKCSYCGLAHKAHND